MRRIFKHKLEITGEDQFIDVLGHGYIVLIGEQDGDLFLWYEGDESVEKETLTVMIVGTGHSIEDDYCHWQSAQMSNGLVWHIYTKL